MIAEFIVCEAEPSRRRNIVAGVEMDNRSVFTFLSRLPTKPYILLVGLAFVQIFEGL